jgi:SAM-dependent methyltransferase
MDAGVIYRCPHCTGRLEKGPDQWGCAGCRRQFEVRGGVPILDIMEGTEGGFLRPPDQHRFLRDVEQRGWEAALQGLHGPRNRLQEAIAPNRISWRYLFQIDSSWKVLDIGAGTGGVACQLARECSVVALDNSWCDMAFLYLRGKQEGLKNFEAVVADATCLPFESGQIDLATMIGVLEWVPISWPQQDPQRVQLKALQEANRILKPGVPSSWE